MHFFKKNKLIKSDQDYDLTVPSNEIYLCGDLKNIQILHYL